MLWNPSDIDTSISSLQIDLDGNSKDRFKILGKICEIEDDPGKPVRTWISIKDFTSKTEAYKSVLQEARAWIDAQPAGE